MSKRDKQLAALARSELEADPTIAQAQAFADKHGIRLRQVRRALLGPNPTEQFPHIDPEPRGSFGPEDVKRLKARGLAPSCLRDA